MKIDGEKINLSKLLFYFLIDSVCNTIFLRLRLLIAEYKKFNLYLLLFGSALSCSPFFVMFAGLWRVNEGKPCYFSARKQPSGGGYTDGGTWGAGRPRLRC